MMPSDEVLEWFFLEMKKKLKANDWKENYHLCDFGFLSKRLHEEAHELSRVLEKAKYSNDYAKVISEAADVANFAIFIAENAQELIREMENSR